MADPRDPYLAAIAKIVDVAPWFEQWDLLEAVADLLTEHARTRDRHRRDMNDECRDSQHSARDAYTLGRHDGGRTEQDW